MEQVDESNPEKAQAEESETVEKPVAVAEPMAAETKAEAEAVA